MKKIYSLAVAAASLVASNAYAADLAPVYKAAPVMAPVYNWTGLYVGGHVGYGWGETNVAPTGIATPMKWRTFFTNHPCVRRLELAAAAALY